MKRENTGNTGKRAVGPTSKGRYYYDTDCERIHITDWQAEQIYRQKERNYVALDLLTEIKEHYSHNPMLKDMRVEDLEEFADALQEQYDRYNDNECLWAACRDVIEDIIIPVQMRKLQDGNHITVTGRDGGMKK